MSLPCEHEWELNRENIRPLRGGRSVHAINTVFGGAKVSMKEAEAKFESDLKKAEESSDPVEICVKYVAWFEEQFPSGKQSHLCPMLTRIINKFGHREEYLNDERMLKIWFKLVENRGNASPEAIFERAFTAGCCRRMAKFYIRWAEIHEDMRDIEGARAIFNRARENRAEPLSLLNEAVDEFEMRQLRALTEMDTCTDEDADVAPNEPMRIALGGLTGLGRDLRAPAVRNAVTVADGLRSGAQRQAPFGVFVDGTNSSTSANAFMVFEGGEASNEQNVLIPQHFGEDLARVEIAENRWEPAKWKQSHIGSFVKSKQIPPAAFDVFDEVEYKKQKKERKEREKANSCLLIRDEVISPEELFAMDNGELPVDVSVEPPTHLTTD
uniref:BUB1 N-terminal domain-containing protein n=1 Tax=Parascaris univalens TaxID=6257 RepID=A0A915BT65_PARUN